MNQFFQQKKANAEAKSSSDSEMGDIDIADDDDEEKIIEMRRKKREELLKVINVMQMMPVAQIGSAINPPFSLSADMNKLQPLFYYSHRNLIHRTTFQQRNPCNQYQTTATMS